MHYYNLVGEPHPPWATLHWTIHLRVLYLPWTAIVQFNILSVVVAPVVVESSVTVMATSVVEVEVVTSVVEVATSVVEVVTSDVASACGEGHDFCDFQVPTSHHALAWL
jgi:hypothetical protein